MKRFSLLISLTLAALAFSQSAHAMRCGSKLVNEGDLAFEVLERCGEPRQRDIVGYTLTYDQRREFKIEEWVYGPRSGVYYILTFEGTRLSRIESRRKQ
ncbi:DUF2845 domain-containing protein [Atopomonas sediminilitoris]|uniref:DUF2845 domain-containing protein n=1 Tax=Atopomonas sediminilitoris TaxID=2919919 RepID=UPI001F4EB055|nr:DUF2845 domain-containing protein [Atopomonas sediminilitoris]MCJ8168848.1 DUF2845 domain-containing protein [Atopomonas sediminilitoris]